MGFRTEMSANLASAVLSEPNRLRGLIDNDDWRDTWLKAFRTRLEHAERDAVRIYAELMGELGHKMELAQLVVIHVGADLETAKRAVDAMKQATGDKRTLISQCETYLLDMYREDPTALERSPLAGLLSGSRAEVVGGEGIDNG